MLTTYLRRQSASVATLFLLALTIMGSARANRGSGSRILVVYEAPPGQQALSVDSLRLWIRTSAKATEELKAREIHVIPLPDGTVADALREFPGHLNRVRPRIVVLQLGLNDAALTKGAGRIPLAQFEELLVKCVEQIVAAGAECVLATPNPARCSEAQTFVPSGTRVCDEAGQDLLVRQYAWVVRNVARQRGLRVADVFRELEYGETRGRYRVADLLQSDGRHLNHRGFRVVADALAGAIAGALRSESPPDPMPPSTAKHHFDIPLIDLARDTARQIVVDREPGQYLGHPSSVLLEDGRTLIVVYPKGHGRGAIVMKRSTDGGLTWSERLPVRETWATSRETPTIYRTVDPSGKRRLVLFSGLYPIRTALSEDDGLTWTELEPIGDYGGIVAVASVLRLRDGRYMAFFHDDGRFLRGDGGPGGQFTVFSILSEDGGVTWSEPRPIVSLPYAHLCEPGAVRSPDGAQIALLLRENSRRYNSFVIFSDDEGQTWSEPRELPGALTGDRHVAQYLPDGRLFISFRDRTPDAGSPTEGDWAGWIGTYEDLVNGTEGQYRLRLADNTHEWDCCYPTTHLLPDGTVVTITYGHWREGEAPYILEVRFRAEEIDRLAGGG